MDSVGSSPRSPGTQFISFGSGVTTVKGAAAVEEPFLTATGKTIGGGVVRGILVTPAQVLGGVGLWPRPFPMG